jgi:hypothetical protein
MDMMITMYASCVAFLFLNTISFYILDDLSNKMMENKNTEIKDNDLLVYSFIRILAKIAGLSSGVTISYNFITTLIEKFFNA